MFDQTGKLWFKIVAFVILEVFLFTIVDVSWAANDLQNESSSQLYQNGYSKEKLELKEKDESPLIVPVNMLLLGERKVFLNKDKSEGKVKLLVEDLKKYDLPLEQIAQILLGSGASTSDAVFSLLKNGYKVKDARNALVSTGFKADQIDSLIGNIIIKEGTDNVSLSSTADSTKKEVLSTSGGENLSTLGIGDKVQISFEPKSRTGLEALISDNGQINVNVYNTLIEQGISDDQIISFLAEKGMESKDILKAASDQGIDMPTVVKDMQDEGFSLTEIVDAFISKAMDWTVDTSVNLINCAVESLAEILSGNSSVGIELYDLAIEVMFADILGNGELVVEDGQVLTSMSSIQQVASEYGLELNAMNLFVSDLEDMQEMQ